MTKHQATAVIILREQVTGEWRPDSRGQGVEAKAKAKAPIFCPRGQGHLEDPIPDGHRNPIKRKDPVDQGVIHTRKERDKSMNQGNESCQLPHMYYINYII